jgi:transcription initiation factor TFIID subunit 6
VEGVQPSIPQNPTANSADLLPKGPNANPHLAAANGLDNVNVKPLVKHVLSKESQELFAKLSSALIDETNIEWQNAALAAIQTEPGIHQLTTYLLSFIAEKVTHNMKNIFVLHQMMRATQSLLENEAIFLDPYLAYMVPPVLTCCTGSRLGPANSQISSTASSETMSNGTNPFKVHSVDQFQLRTYAAAILGRICEKGASSNQGLKARIARTCLKQFMDPQKTSGTHFGALRALISITHKEGIRMLILPNLKAYGDEVLAVRIAKDDERYDAERVVKLLFDAVSAYAGSGSKGRSQPNGVPDLHHLRDRLSEKVGDLLAERLVAQHEKGVAEFLITANLDL